ncbi:RNA helicase required for poly(A+) mRNA export [Microbotryomycetes sp. JL201]|nr:RNA helicase required for poly(A+) mRNA export [Microbotryomycetes sp. JL201]
MAKEPQIILFSATFADAVRKFAVSFAPNANEIRLKQEELTVDAIKQFFMGKSPSLFREYCEDEEHKYEVLVELYNLLTIGQSIIFVKRRDTADRIASRMTSEGHAVTSLHGKLETAERDAVMASFRDGRTKVLITTNVVARGIDISQVNVVINYDLPTDGNGKPDPETYLHRIGRTGRFGRQGVSINFVHDRRSFETMEAIRNALGKPIVRVDTSDFELMEKTLKTAMKA